MVWNISDAVTSEGQGGLKGEHTGRICVKTESVMISWQNLSDVSPILDKIIKKAIVKEKERKR